MTEDPIKFATYDSAITFNTQQPGSFTFCGVDNVPLITIKPDGTIERGPAFTTTDAASLEFWDALARLGMRRS